MFTAPEELMKKIRLGEDSSLELKEVLVSGGKIHGPHRDGMADELSAFANGSGGACLLGVRDKSRSVIGIPLEYLDLVETWVRDLAQDAIKPPILLSLERMWLPDAKGQEQPVLKIEVPKSLFVHRSPGGYLHRVGSSKREMAPDYLARLFQQRSQTRLIRFDEQPIPQASLEDLDKNLYERFKSPRTRDQDGTFLGKLAMANQDETGSWRPTVTGVLMASTDPRRWLPNAFIQAVAYSGCSAVTENLSRIYQLDASDITGPLDRQVIDACRFVKKNMRVAARKEMGRQDLPQFDMTAVFEALVNAVAHRDYSIYGSKIRLRLFQDRLEIYTPGQLPNTMTVESIAYRQSARNEALTSLLAKCQVPDIEWLPTSRSTLMDKRGEGVQLILERSEALSGRTPTYRLIDESELLLTIFAAEAK